MPTLIAPKSALYVERLRKPGRYSVGGAPGLHMRIDGNSKAWVLRLKVGAKRCDIGLGPYPEVSLTDAREKALAMRKRVREDDHNPVEANRVDRAAKLVEKTKLKTFKACAIAYMADKKAEWGNDKHEKQWAATLETYAYPKIGDKSVASIDMDMVLTVLQPIWITKPETASRLRGRIEKVLDWAKVSKLRDGENPAQWRGNLQHKLSKPKKLSRGHHPALPYAAIGAFMVELRKCQGTGARALEFGILCASRSGEIRGAKWGEISADGNFWTIPIERMKAKAEHIVPLSAPAKAVLDSLTRGNDDGFIFPAPRGGTLSDMALTAVLKRMGHAKITQHGFRSTFREWAGETRAADREIIEHALAHQLADKVEAAYQRGKMLPPRVPLMTKWATFCGTVAEPNANVFHIMPTVTAA